MENGGNKFSCVIKIGKDEQLSTIIEKMKVGHTVTLFIEMISGEVIEHIQNILYHTSQESLRRWGK